MDVRMTGAPKLKMYISKIILDNYKYIPVSIRNNALHAVTFTKMSVACIAVT
jgi:hypothetical protein